MSYFKTQTRTLLQSTEGKLIVAGVAIALVLTVAPLFGIDAQESAPVTEPTGDVLADTAAADEPSEPIADALIIGVPLPPEIPQPTSPSTPPMTDEPTPSPGELTPTCTPNPKRDLVSGGKNYDRPMPPSLKTITVSGGQATVTVTNTSDACSYNIGLASYEAHQLLGTPETDPGNQNFILNQKLFDDDLTTIGPGETVELVVSVPSCAFQVDLFIGDYAPEPPDFATLQNNGTHTLLDFTPYWLVDSGLPACGDTPPPPPPPPTCDNPNPQADIEITGDNGAFSDGLVFSGTKVSAEVKNTSSVCTYQIALASYKTYVLQTPETVADGSYINTQKLFDDQVVTLGPGEKKMLMVELPSCNYQVDLFWTKSGDVPVPPDFAKLQNAGTHWLFKWKGRHDAGVCTDIPVCPLNPPIIPHANTVNGTVNQAFSYTIPLLSGDAPITFSIVQGTLPAGLTFNPVTRTISGVPTVATTKVVTIKASNQCGEDTIELTIIIGQGICPLAVPHITSPVAANGIVGQAFSHTITATGGAPLTYSLTGTLPAGLTFNPTTHVISGIPTQKETKTVVVKVQNECGFDTQELTITINDSVCTLPVPGIETEGSGNATVGQPFTHPIALSGGQPITVTATGLPSWLSVQHTSGSFEASLAGTPTDAGEFSVTVKAENACGSAVATVTITVTGVCELTPPKFVTESETVVGTVGAFFSHTLALSQGDEPITFTLTDGTLPSGLSLSGNVISGTTTAVADVVLEFAATNACGGDTTQLRIKINDIPQCTLEVPTITSPVSASGTVNQAFSYTITYSGGEPITLTVDTSNLPIGLSYATSTKIISGTPTQTGTFGVLIRASNICGADDITLQITIDDGGGGCTSNCGGGGGGGGSRPRVRLFSSPEPEVLGTAVALSQVPYTGVGSVLQAILFLLGLLAVSGGITFVVLRKRMRARVPHIVVGTPAAAPVEMRREDKIALEETTHTQETTPPSSEYRVPQPVTNTNVPQSEDEQTLELFARGEHVLLSADATRTILAYVHGDRDKAQMTLRQVIATASARYPREDGWLLLNQSRVSDILFPSQLSTAPLFVEWLVSGNQEKIFSFLRTMSQQGRTVEEFLRKIIYELDTVHRARIEGTHADGAIVGVVSGLSLSELEALIESLTRAVDGGYSSALTGAKVALTRILEERKRSSSNSQEQSLKTAQKEHSRNRTHR